MHAPPTARLIRDDAGSGTLAVSSDGSAVALAVRDRIEVLDLETGGVRTSVALPGKKGTILGVALHGERLAVARGRAVYEVDLEGAPSARPRITHQHGHEVSELFFQGDVLVSAARFDGRVILSASDGAPTEVEVFGRAPKGHELAVMQVALDPGRSRLLCVVRERAGHASTFALHEISLEDLTRRSARDVSSAWEGDHVRLAVDETGAVSWRGVAGLHRLIAAELTGPHAWQTYPAGPGQAHDALARPIDRPDLGALPWSCAQALPGTGELVFRRAGFAGESQHTEIDVPTRSGRRLLVVPGAAAMLATVRTPSATRVVLRVPEGKAFRLVLRTVTFPDGPA